MTRWDGSHIKLSEFVRKNLHNPSSFEHVQTKYTVYKDYAIVTMNYRAKNAFNATILNSVKAEVSLKDCSVLGVE